MLTRLGLRTPRSTALTNVRSWTGIVNNPWLPENKVSAEPGEPQCTESRTSRRAIGKRPSSRTVVERYGRPALCRSTKPRAPLGSWRRKVLLAILPGQEAMIRPKDDEDLLEVAEKIAARRGRDDADAFLRFWRQRRDEWEKDPITDEEAMELAVSELHAMRAEQDQKVKSGR